MNNGFRAYDSLVEKISDAFSPRIVVAASKSASQSCHRNYLTPAELLNPFVTNLRVGNDRGEVEYYDETRFPAQARYRKVRLVDVEEWTPLDDGYLDSHFSHNLEKNKPNCAALQAFDLKLEKPKEFLKQYGWDTAVSTFSELLTSIGKEYECSWVNECWGVLIMVSASEDDLAGAVREVEKAYSSQLKAALGGDINERTHRIIMVLHDEKEAKRELHLSELDDKIDQFKRTYSRAIWKSLRINSFNMEQGSPEWRNLWTEEFIAFKRKIKAYETSDEKVDVNKPDLPRGQYISKTMWEVDYPNAIKDIFSNEISKKFEDTVRENARMALEKKKNIKKGFMGLSIFKKEEKAYHTSDGKYRLTDIEYAMKKFADSLMTLGMFGDALKEYIELLEQISKVRSLYLEIFRDNQCFK